MITKLYKYFIANLIWIVRPFKSLTLDLYMWLWLCDLWFPAPYSPSLHNDPRGTGEPVSNLRSCHYSPVFYLLDNGKNVSSPL